MSFSVACTKQCILQICHRNKLRFEVISIAPCCFFPMVMGSSGTVAGHLTTDIPSIEAQIQSVDRIRTRGPLRSDEKRAIVWLYFALTGEAAESAAKSGKEVHARARQRTARLLGFGFRTVSTVIKNLISVARDPESTDENYGKLVCSDYSCGSKSKKLTRIIEEQELFCNVRNFIQEKHSYRETVTAKNVLNYLIENKYFSV